VSHAAKWFPTALRDLWGIAHCKFCDCRFCIPERFKMALSFLQPAVIQGEMLLSCNMGQENEMA
jgi:hypothetical protein